jgi:hypothetical protein
LSSNKALIEASGGPCNAMDLAMDAALHEEGDVRIATS